jgi:S-adenosylmethionine hydrolase
MAIVALMSDFGLRDHYVASMKGVILQSNPKVTLVDVTHEIAPQDLFHGGYVLRQALPYFPAGTIFIAVVDPGVGTRRRIIAARYSDRVVLAPDNGLLTMVHRDAELQEIRFVENRKLFATHLSSTFHGRDIFAPVAAHLSRGVPMQELGPTANRIEALDIPHPAVHPDGDIDGQVIVEDHFGNLITNIAEPDLTTARHRKEQLLVTVNGRAIGPVRQTYSEVAAGEPVALVGSAQLLEIAVNNGNAARQLGLARGAAVTIR